MDQSRKTARASGLDAHLQAGRDGAHLSDLRLRGAVQGQAHQQGSRSGAHRVQVPGLRLQRAAPHAVVGFRGGFQGRPARPGFAHRARGLSGSGPASLF